MEIIFQYNELNSLTTGEWALYLWIGVLELLSNISLRTLQYQVDSHGGDDDKIIVWPVKKFHPTTATLFIPDGE